MKARPPARTTWLLCLFLLLWLPVSAGAQTYSVAQGPSSDTLTITFPKNTPPPVVLRTGPNRVEALFPQGVALKPAPASLGRGRFVAGVGVSDNVLVVQTSGNAFGYIFSPKGPRGYQIQFYADPQGATWQPPAQADGNKPEESPAAGSQATAPTPAPAPAQTPSPQAPSAGQTQGQQAAQAPAQSAAPAAAALPAPSSQVRGVIGSNAPAAPQAAAGAQPPPPQAATQQGQTVQSQTSGAQPGAPIQSQAAAPATLQPGTATTPPGPGPAPAPAAQGSGLSGRIGGQVGQPGAQSQPAASAPASSGAPAGQAAQAGQHGSPATPAAVQPFPAAVPAPPSPAQYREAASAPSAPQAGQPSQAQPNAPSAGPAIPAPAAPGASSSSLTGGIGGQIGQPSSQTAAPGVVPAQGAPGSAPAGQTPGQQPSGQQTSAQPAAPGPGAGQPAPGQTPPSSAAQSGEVGPGGAPGQPAAPAPNEIRGSISQGGPQAAPIQQPQAPGQPQEQAAPQAGEAKPQGPMVIKGGIGEPSGQPVGQEAASKAPGQEPGQAQQAGQSGQVAEKAPAPAAAIDDAARKAISGAPAGDASAPAPGAEQAGAEPEKKGDSLEDSTFLISGEQALAKEDFVQALSIANTLLEKKEISKELREGALYLRAEAAFALNKGKLAETYEETNNILQEALNYNTTSFKLPRMLIKLGYLNLRQGNLPEARAYFNLLAKKYPLDEDVPLIDVYWGQYYLDQAKQRDAKANLEKAAEAFKRVLSKHPESRFARDAALGVSQALSELGQFEEASKIIDYIDKRWPRYYIENPVMRRVSADVAYKLGDYAKAKDDYLWFYNLVPKDSKNDLVLARLGDVSMKLGKREAAREFYDMAIRLYPGQEGALMAMMRLAEQGIHDAPTLQEMFKAFKDPTEIRPEKIYEIIVNEFPKSPLAPLALLKLAMWNLYKEQFPEALELVSRFNRSYPGDELEKQAVEVGVQAFAKIIRGLLEQSDYKRILELWRKYPFLATRPDLLPDLDRLGVALALYYQGAPKEALTMVEPYLEKGPSPDTQKALALMLTIYRENQDWQAILDTLKKVSEWNLADGPRRALEFAQAMALEHTGQFARSRLLWARLAADPELAPDKRAYAVYYQARTAMDRQDYGKALVWAQEARTLFKEAAKDDGKARDALLLMIEANQAAGRLREALALCAEYETEAPEKSAEWAANRLRMAKLSRMLGDIDQWRKILEEMRDSLGDTLYGKLAASELNARGLEERAGRLAGPP